MSGNIAITGSNHQSTKIQNRALVLKLICTGNDISRVDISRLTGLSRMSITNIVNELIEEGFVLELSAGSEQIQGGAIGRKPVFLAPDTKTHLALGIYISRDYAVATLANMKCEILYKVKCSFSFDESEASFIDKIKGIIRTVLDSDIANEKKLLGMGVACIGPLDIKNGVILEPPNFHQLRVIPIKEILEKEFGYNVQIDNDMNASAIAEKLYGKAKETDNFLYIGVTNGIGAGIITNGALFQGDMGFSGEIGHTTINFEGPKCACGNTGCLELYASIPEIVSQAKNSVALGLDSALREIDTIEWLDIVKYASLGDKLCLNLLDRLCLYISIGLVSLANIFDPRTIYLGHDIAHAGELITKKLESIVNEKIISSKYKSIPVEVSAYGDMAPIAGASAIVLNRLFSY
jgi:predicted NBD/HSP70 family sugar kinase